MLFTNEKLFRFGMADSPSCVFCQTEVESVGYCFVLAWLIRRPVFSAKQRLNP